MSITEGDQENYGNVEYKCLKALMLKVSKLSIIPLPEAISQFSVQGVTSGCEPGMGELT